MMAKSNPSTSKINSSLESLAMTIGSLHEDPNNARRHAEYDIGVIAKSLNEYGQQKPIIATKSGRVIAGNGTLVAARDVLGWSEIAVVTFDDEDQAKQAAYALVDNRSSELSTWDFEELSNALSSLPKDLISDLGWNDRELSSIMSSVDSSFSLDGGTTKEITDLGIGTHRCPKCGFEYDE